MKAIVLLSGGQDSLASLCWALGAYLEVEAVCVNYGQSHAFEVEAAIKIAKLTGTPLEIIDAPDILLSASPLVNFSNPLERYESFDQMADVIGDRVEVTFVPMRNTFFLVLLANRAIAKKASAMVIGVCEADESNYPDCRELYLIGVERALNLSIAGAGKLKIESPVLHKSKKETVEYQFAMGTKDFSLLAFSHTAYDGSYPPVGNDHASILRAKGFEDASLPDPLMLRAVSENLLPMPSAPNYHNDKLNSTIIEEIAAHKKVLQQ